MHGLVGQRDRQRVAVDEREPAAADNGHLVFLLTGRGRAPSAGPSEGGAGGGAVVRGFAGGFAHRCHQNSNPGQSSPGQSGGGPFRRGGGGGGVEQF